MISFLRCLSTSERVPGVFSSPPFPWSTWFPGNSYSAATHQWHSTCLHLSQDLVISSLPVYQAPMMKTWPQFVVIQLFLIVYLTHLNDGQLKLSEPLKLFNIVIFGGIWWPKIWREAWLPTLKSSQFFLILGYHCGALNMFFFWAKKMLCLFV